ncbi:MAG UNVERIFIED_CONTAM: HAMP domain-containing protein, partial [Thermobifida fusca]
MPRLMPRMKNRTLTESELDALLDALYRMRDGDFTVRLSPRGATRFSEVARVLNEVFDQCEQLSNEVQRVSETVSTDGRLSERVSISPARGSWGQSVRALNQMLDEVSEPVTAVARILDSVANGDLSQRVDLASRHGELHGDLLRLATSVNRMADQMSEFAGEVTRVAREVGTEGKLGGRANVKGVSGIWKDLTDNVNSMSHNLTTQVRNISQVTTAVARGDLTKRITVDAQGEMLELKDTINTMVDQLSTFALEVTRVGHEVGIEGKLGVQAKVAGVSGVWKDLTDSVNELAKNLTTQVRAIASVASAVARGDLTQSIQVSARGELATLKDNVNLMVSNLRETTAAQRDEDWLKSNLARLSGLLQGRRDLNELARLIMTEVTPLVDAQHGACYLPEDENDTETFRLYAGYGYQPSEERRRITAGQGLAGEAIAQRKELIVHNVPGDYVRIESGLGEAPPLSLAIFPIVSEDRV